GAGAVHNATMSEETTRMERITIDPNRMRGLPCIRDTRVTVGAVLGQLAAGQPIEEVLADYPYLEFADILAALAFAAEAMQERELPLAQTVAAPAAVGRSADARPAGESPAGQSRHRLG